MRTPLAWRNMVHDAPRTRVAVAGIAFALVLMFMQIGFLEAVLNTAVIVLDKLDADIFIVSRNYLYFAQAGTFSRSGLEQAAAVPGVAKAVPFYVGLTSWRVPDGSGVSLSANRRSREGAVAPRRAQDAELDAQMRSRRVILVMGFDPSDRPFRRVGRFDPRVSIDARGEELREAQTLLIDRRSRPEFGSQEIGQVREVGLRPFAIRGTFEIGTGFAAEGAILVNDQNFRLLFGPDALRNVSVGLIRLGPGAGADAVAMRLRGLLSNEDCEVWTRRDMVWWERYHWVLGKSIGVIFALGVVVAFLVGLVVVYQVLSSDIMDHSSEYATLKAMGYEARDISGVVSEQALFLAIGGYVPALGLSWVLYRALDTGLGLPIEMNLSIMAIVLVLAVMMCWTSAWISVRKLKLADPAGLFR